MLETINKIFDDVLGSGIGQAVMFLLAILSFVAALAGIYYSLRNGGSSSRGRTQKKMTLYKEWESVLKNSKDGIDDISYEALRSLRNDENWEMYKLSNRQTENANRGAVICLALTCFFLVITLASAGFASGFQPEDREYQTLTSIMLYAFVMFFSFAILSIFSAIWAQGEFDKRVSDWNRILGKKPEKTFKGKGIWWFLFISCLTSVLCWILAVAGVVWQDDVSVPVAVSFITFTFVSIVSLVNIMKRPGSKGFVEQISDLTKEIKDKFKMRESKSSKEDEEETPLAK